MYSPNEEEREQKLNGLMLRKIVRENHHQPIKTILPNWTSITEQSQTSLEDEYSLSVARPVPTYASSSSVAPSSSSVSNRGPRNSNLIATLGANQVNFYDNAHLGQHFDLVANYVNIDPTQETTNNKEESEDDEEDDEDEVEGRSKKAKKNVNGSVPKGKKIEKNRKSKEIEELNCGAWLRVGTNINDALFAVGGNDCAIRIISMLHSRVIGVLNGHSAPVIDLKSCSYDFGDSRKMVILVSISNDQEVKVWDMSEFCDSNAMPRGWMCNHITSTTIPFTNTPTVSAIHPKGRSIIIGDDKGLITEYSISIEERRQEASKCRWTFKALEKSYTNHKNAISCISFVRSNSDKKWLLLTMSNDDKIYGHDYQTTKNLFQLNLKSLSTKRGTKELESAEQKHRKEKVRTTNTTKNCSFGVSDDGAFISTGDDKGRIFLFDINELINSEDESQRKRSSPTTYFAKLEHKRANRIADPRIRATCFGFGCDNLLATSAEYIWRWQYVPTGSLNGINSPPAAVMNSPPPVPLNSPPAPSSK